MDYKELLEQLTDEDNCNVLDYIDDAATAITELLERAEKAERERDAMRDAAIMQQKYQRLYDTHKLSKKAMCELCVPFRDKYGLTDLQTLRIARKEMDLMEIVELLQPKEE